MCVFGAKQSGISVFFVSAENAADVNKMTNITCPFLGTVAARKREEIPTDSTQLWFQRCILVETLEHTADRLSHFHTECHSSVLIRG